MRQINATAAPGSSHRTWLALLSAATLAALLLLPSLPSHGGASSAPPAAEPAAAAAIQLPRPWTAVGSTGVVDEAALNLFAMGTAELTFRPGVQGNLIVARYNVTNTFDNNANPNRPGWTTLEMGSFAPINTVVEARLFRISACNTTPVLLCLASNPSNSAPCARCTLNTPIDFANDLFFIEVRLNRGGQPAALPRITTLRLF